MFLLHTSPHGRINWCSDAPRKISVHPWAWLFNYTIAGGAMVTSLTYLIHYIPPSRSDLPEIILLKIECKYNKLTEKADWLWIYQRGLITTGMANSFCVNIQNLQYILQEDFLYNYNLCHFVLFILYFSLFNFISLLFKKCKKTLAVLEFFNQESNLKRR